MKLSELTELTNRELKNILRENQIKNYSKLNKKDLVKKVNQLIKAQNGEKSGKRKNINKKYTLKELIGGVRGVSESLLSNTNNQPTIYSRESMDYVPPSVKNIPITQKEKNNALLQQQQQQQQQQQPEQLNQQQQQQQPEQLTQQQEKIPSAPFLSKNEKKKLENNEEARQINEAKKASLQKEEGCGACSIQ